MTYEKETLKLLRQSLDEEDDETSIIPIMENHHKYLKESIDIFLDPTIDPTDKMATAKLFFPIFTMHAKAEEEIFYDALKDVTADEVEDELRVYGLKAKDEHAIIFKLMDELKKMECEIYWTQEVEAKFQILSNLLKNHLKEEEQVIFPLAEKHIPESQLLNMSDDYLERCKIYLVDLKEGVSPLEVSRSDVITLFY